MPATKVCWLCVNILYVATPSVLNVIYVFYPTRSARTVHTTLSRKAGSNQPVSKHRIQSRRGEWAGWRGIDCRIFLARPNPPDTYADRESYTSPVQLTTSLIGLRSAESETKQAQTQKWLFFVRPLSLLCGGFKPVRSPQPLMYCM